MNHESGKWSTALTLLVFSAPGGMGHEANIFYKRLASLLCDKWKDPYAAVLNADFPFVYFVRPSNALGEQDHHKIITLEVPLWPWFNQKLIFQFNCLLCLLVFQIN